MPVRLHTTTPDGTQHYLWIDETSRMVMEGHSGSSKDMLRDAQGNITIETEPYQLKSALADSIIAGYTIMDVNDVPDSALDLLRQNPKVRQQLRSYRMVMNYIRKRA